MSVSTQQLLKVLKDELHAIRCWRTALEEKPVGYVADICEGIDISESKITHVLTEAGEL